MWWLEETVSTFNGLDISSLGTDEAWLNISSSCNTPLWVFVLSDNCYTCSFQKLSEQPIRPNESYNTTINSQYGLKFQIRHSTDDRFAVCDLWSKLGEFGVYTIHIKDEQLASHPCSLTTDLEPVATYYQTEDNVPTSSSTITLTAGSQCSGDNPVVSTKERLRSLDVFRGLCILIMIIADDGGGGYFFLQHCAWDGLYVADLAFPWFIWICGTSIPFSIHARLARNASKRSLFLDVLVRSMKLVMLGLVVNTSTKPSAVHLEQLRFPGVLQRFGVCYLIGSALLIWSYKPTQSLSSNADQRENSGWRRHFGDFKCTIGPWIIVLTLVACHTLILFTLPVPDCPKGYIGPAGLHNGSTVAPACVGGAAGYLDRLIFGINHIHNRPTATRVYGSGPFDPEGILGVLTSVLHVWLGVQAGMLMLTYKSVKSRVLRLMTWSIFCCIVGLLLCGGYQNSGLIPLNKNLWSLSFVLVTSSAAFSLLCLLYLVIDTRKIWNGSPLLEAGRNSILLYLGHEFCHAALPWNFSYGKMTSHTSQLMETFWGTAVWMLVAVYLHDRNIFFVV